MIPRTLAHIWIGPQPAPTEWMETWRAAHPGWEYRLYDNEFLTSRRFRNQHLINEYFRRGEYPGVSDLMRYEILYEVGGFIPEADSLCVNPVDDLFVEAKAYTVYEFPGGRTGMMSPFLASNAGNPVLRAVIETLSQLEPANLNRPWNSVGNGFLRRFHRKNRRLAGDMIIFPSHYFIPEHNNGEVYSGTDKIYARQLWGSTTRSYPFSRGRSPLSAEEIAQRRDEVLQKLGANLDLPAPPLP